MKTLFERQLYEHIHHEYKSGEHFDSLSSRQPHSDLLRSLCCAPLLTASIVISLFSQNICLQEEAVCSSLLATFPRRPARVSEGRRAAPLHGCAQAGAAQTSIRAGRPAISAHFSLTPRREALAKRWRSPDTRPLASKVEASKVSIVSGSLSDFALISGVARVLNLDLLTLKCLSRGNDPRRVHKPKCWLNAPLFILRHQITVASGPAHIERRFWAPSFQPTFFSPYTSERFNNPLCFISFPQWKWSGCRSGRRKEGARGRDAVSSKGEEGGSRASTWRGWVGGWRSRSPTHPHPAPRLCGTIAHRHYVTACPPPPAGAARSGAQPWLTGSRPAPI